MLYRAGGRKGEYQTDTETLEEWVASVQNGCTQDYARIVSACQRPIFIYCCRMLGNEQEAEDAAQDIFVRAYQSIRGYRRERGFSAWLYTIAYRHCLNALRRQAMQRRKQLLFRAEETADSPEQIVDGRSFSPSLDAALRRLTPFERSLLVLSVLEERTSAEIAAIVGKSPEAVKKRIGRTKRKVRDMLEEEGEAEWNGRQALVKTKA